MPRKPSKNARAKAAKPDPTPSPQPPEGAPLVYTMEEACALLRLHRDTVRKLIAEGKLRAIRVGGRGTIRISARALHELLGE